MVDVPQDLGAEEALVGAALIVGDVVDYGSAIVGPEDFYKPALSDLWAALSALRAVGDPTDPTTVVSYLREREGPAAVDRVGGPASLVSLQAATPATSRASVERWARAVLASAVRRRVLGAAAEIRDLAIVPGDTETMLEEARARIAAVEGPPEIEGRDDDVEEFLDAGSDAFDWVVPGIVERGDRTLLVAPEGAGKSTLFRQLAVQISQGIHPITNGPIRPASCLLVDLENSSAQLRRKLRPLVAAARAYGGQDAYDPDRLRIISRSEGVDLTRRTDSRWFLGRIAANRPDVLLVGPLYRLYRGDQNDETVARAVAAVIDEARARYGISVLLEVHAPQTTEGGRHRDLRPRGAALWRGWPEVGLVLVPDADGAVDVRRFRGDRDERDWPARFVRGGKWPWTAIGTRPVVDENQGQF